MERNPYHLNHGLSLFGMALILGLSACGGNGGTTTAPVPPPSTTPVEPTFGVKLFDTRSANVVHRYFPLQPGEVRVYEGMNSEGKAQRVEVSVSHKTRVVDGVDSAEVVVREYVEGDLIEETFDWYAQDTAGNVWYLGEAVQDYEDGAPVGTAGSWESGKDVAGTGTAATAGLIMKSQAAVGDRYKQERYPGVAEDEAQVAALAAPQTLRDGSSYLALQIRESTPLESNALHEFKYYADAIGLISTERVDGSARMELISRSDQRKPSILPSDFSTPRLINNPYFPLYAGDVRTYEVFENGERTETVTVEVLSPDQPEGNKTVNGVPVVVQRDRVRDADGLIIEDTYDWFAQDDEGNVWYLGENVTNYVYDDKGALLSTNNGGSFEWGIDGAQPGIQMPARPRIGDSYRQEFYAGHAEDIAAVVDRDIDVDVLGNTYPTLKTEDWNPLDAGASREFKFYASSVGTVREEKVDGSEFMTLADRRVALPDIGAAKFSNPRVINNPLFPLTIGEVREYEVFEENTLTETITIEILALDSEGGNKTVNGVPALVQRDRVRNADGLIIEDTFDWFAQDDAGNVWYLGEAVTNYRYDDQGKLLGTDSGGSFEWGIDGALPGIQMFAQPKVGDIYRQEFYQGVAEDMAAILAENVKVVVNGTEYATVQTLDWNPLVADSVNERKYYAPGMGTIREEKVDGSEYMVLKSLTRP